MFDLIHGEQLEIVLSQDANICNEIHASQVQQRTDLMGQNHLATVSDNTRDVEVYNPSSSGMPLGVRIINQQHPS